MKTKTHWSEILVKHGACNEAVEWAKTQKSAAAAWKNCERADWLLWAIGTLTREKRGSPLHRKIVLCACAIARTALKHVPDNEKRPLAAIETAERWARNEGVTDEELAAAMAAARDARDAASDAAWAARAAASDAALAAARDASDAASDAARAAAWAAAWAAALKSSADIVRKMIPMPRIAARKKGTR